MPVFCVVLTVLTDTGCLVLGHPKYVGVHVYSEKFQLIWVAMAELLARKTQPQDRGFEPRVRKLAHQ